MRVDAEGLAGLGTLRTFESDWVSFDVAPAATPAASPAALLAAAPPEARGLLAEYLSALGLLPDAAGFFAPPAGAMTLDDHAGPPFLVRLAPGAKLPLACRGAAVHSCRAMHYNSPVVPGREFAIGAWDRPGVHRAVCDVHGKPGGWGAVEK